MSQGNYATIKEPFSVSSIYKERGDLHDQVLSKQKLSLKTHIFPRDSK